MKEHHTKYNIRYTKQYSGGREIVGLIMCKNKAIRNIFFFLNCTKKCNEVYEKEDFEKNT